MSITVQDFLGKAGAGLPRHQLLALRYVAFPLLKKLYTWEKSFEVFEAESRHIIDLAARLDEKELFTRVLVPQTFGIEDNSRYYSAAMVLEHLTQVGQSIRDGIITLSHNTSIERDVTIEAYKPYGEIDSHVIETYSRMTANYRTKILNRIGNPRASATHEHPWFGPMTPHGWLVLSALHQRIHRRQLEKIIKGLKNAPKA
jgi:hypothetical protein